MRGLEEIKKINETPNGFHGDSNEHEQFRPSQRLDSGRSKSDHILDHALTSGQPKSAAFAKNFAIASMINSNGEMTPEQVKEMAAVGTVFDLLGLSPPDNYDQAHALATLLAVKAIKTLDKTLDKIGGDKPTRTLADRSRLNDKGDRFLGMDGIHAAIGEQPDFMKFWLTLNDDDETRGREATYGEAKLAWSGGETPVGALTFIGKEWDGLRAVPVTSVHGKAYHGEFRSIASEGNAIWNVVSNTSSLPIIYTSAEAALNGARHARIHSKQAALNDARRANR